MITVIGIFENPELADEASSYLLANDFESENIDIHTHADEPETDRIGNFFSHLFENEKEASHYASLGRTGSIVTIHAASTREAQEAVDVFNQYGAVEVDAEATDTRSLVVSQVVAQNMRLK